MLPASVTRIDALPRPGSSWQFTGRDHNDVPFSFYIVEMQPGRGAPLHTHPYDEVLVVQLGHALVVVGDSVHEAGPGSIFVAKAHTPHGFVNTGSSPLTQIDIHASCVFQQTDLPPTAVSRAAGLPESGTRSAP